MQLCLDYNRDLDRLKEILQPPAAAAEDERKRCVCDWLLSVIVFATVVPEEECKRYLSMGALVGLCILRLSFATVAAPACVRVVMLSTVCTPPPSVSKSDTRCK